VLTYALATLYHVEPGLALLGVAAAEGLVVCYGVALAIERWLFRMP
jgi:hypothetical protein